ncbi:MAG: SspB family protein [Caulobacteraceae bacterium]
MASDGRNRDLIGYDALQQDALRGIVRTVLRLAQDKGLPGDHHFFISFKTGAPGVGMPRDLLEQYPDEMRIVLQLQFWDLEAGENAFSVTLRFGGQPKALTIPYAAVTHFWDPSVEFQLRFVVDAPPALQPAPEAKATEAGPDEPGTGEANIVSLDQFRKK